MPRLAALAPQAYEDWTLTDLRDALTGYGISVHKSDGRKVVRVEDIAAALRDRTTDQIRQHQHRREHGGEATRETSGSQGLLPASSLTESPCADQRKHVPGTVGTPPRGTPETRRNRSDRSERTASLPAPYPDRTRGDSG